MYAPSKKDSRITTLKNKANIFRKNDGLSMLYSQGFLWDHDDAVIPVFEGRRNERTENRVQIDIVDSFWVPQHVHYMI